MAALANRPPGRRQSSQRPPPTRGLIYNVPLEIIFKIFQLVAPPRARDGMYRLLKLTHVCRLWRVTLINKPQAWATIFATRKDRRSFVETCLERSASVPLEVTVDVVSWTRRYPMCTCRSDRRSRLIPNEANPCERHFVFEPLAEAEHSGRINTLKIQFYEGPLTFRDEIAFGGCRFFTSFPLQLRTLSGPTQDRRTPFTYSLPCPSPSPCAPCLSTELGTTNSRRSITSLPSPSSTARSTLTQRPFGPSYSITSPSRHSRSSAFALRVIKMDPLSTS